MWQSGLINMRFVCKANKWSDETKATKLPTLLEGEALAVWLELSEEQQSDYKQAKEKITDKLAPLKFEALDKFHKRKLRPGEALSVFVHDMKVLLEQAMPRLDNTARDQLLLHQFLTGLPVSLSQQLRATGEARDLNSSIERARLLMSIDTQSQQVAAVEAQSNHTNPLQEQVEKLTEQVAALSARIHRDPQQQKPKRCYKCGQAGHVQRNCFY